MTIQDYNPSPVELKDIFETATALRDAGTTNNSGVYGIGREIIPSSVLNQSGEFVLGQMSQNQNLSPLVQLAGATRVVLFCSSKGSSVQENALALMRANFALVSARQKRSFIEHTTPFLQMKGISFP